MYRMSHYFLFTTLQNYSYNLPTPFPLAVCACELVKENVSTLVFLKKYMYTPVCFFLYISLDPDTVETKIMFEPITLCNTSECLTVV